MKTHKQTAKNKGYARRSIGPYTLLLVTMLLSGCALSNRCRMTVGNASKYVITDVTVQVQNEILYQAEKIPSRTSASDEKMKRNIPQSLRVSWKTHDHQSRSKTVTLQGEIPQSFRGRIYFQISQNDNVKSFITPDSQDTSADMPWAKPESWEGVPGIPGLTTQ